MVLLGLCMHLNGVTRRHTCAEYTSAVRKNITTENLNETECKWKTRSWHVL